MTDPDRQVVYSPESGYTGSDAFTFQLFNGLLTSVPGAVILNGTPRTTRITEATAHGWPNGLTSTDLALAVDGNPATFTLTTSASNTAAANLALDFGKAMPVNRIRLRKDTTGATKDLTIQYTTDSGDITSASRTWRSVSNLQTGFGGETLQTPSASCNGNPVGRVFLDGRVERDEHRSPLSGWASLTFDTVAATAVRIRFNNASCGGGPGAVQYKVYELEAYY